VDSPLSGRVALVTGAGRGIGREIALRLARDGATVVVGRHLSAWGHALAYEADIARRSEVISLFEAIDRDPGHIDTVVHDAGVSVRGELAELDESPLAQAFGINAFGPLYIVSEAAKRLGEGGRVVTSDPP
jgi:3-oxoacyl-[acyl-carrier protein] reductase